MTQSITRIEEDRYAQLQLIALDYAREGDTYGLEKMISHGMNVNLCTHKDDSLLMLASYNGNVQTAKMLLDYGARVDQVNQRGQTPLEGVCFKGNLEMVQLLLDYGASTEGHALAYAAMFGNKDVVKVLMERAGGNAKARFLGLKIEWLVSITSTIKNILR